MKSKSVNDILMGTPKSNPYYGEVNLKIDTSLADANKEPERKFSLVKDENTFNIQSLKLPEIVYNKIIKLTGQEQITKESFNIPDKTKKYSLIVMKTSNDDNIDIKINNIPQINKSDFEKYKYMSFKQLILEDNNSIDIKVIGKTNNSFIITVVESSKVETIRKHIQNIKWKEVTQNSRQQIFLPDDLSSLGNLKPYEGDIIDSNNPELSIGVSTANDTKAVFTNGYVAVTLREPAQQNLDLLKDRLNAAVESFKDYDGNKIAILKINYEQTNLSNLYSNFKELNTFSQAPIKEATFSSINSAKTISTFIDLLVNNSDLISNAGLLSILQQNGASISPDMSNSIVTDESQSNNNYYTTYANTNYDNDKQGEPIYKSTPKTSKDSWWLLDSNIIKAWKYSLGQNTNIGILDTDFSGFSGAYLTNQLNVKNYLSTPNSDTFTTKLESLDCKDLGRLNPDAIYCDSITKKLGHGYKVSSIIASDIDDNYGNAGVSPRSKLSLLTYNDISLRERVDSRIISISQLMKSLNNKKQNILSSGVDIINISSGNYLSEYDFLNTKENPLCLDGKKLMYKGGNLTAYYLCGTIPIQAAKDIFELSNFKNFPDGSKNLDYNENSKSIVFIASAGNSNDLVAISQKKFFFPGSFSNVINVGAYEIDNKRIRADFSLKSKDVNGYYLSSNYGEIDIWAPGDNIPVMPENDTKWLNAGGTSFASPVIAGVTALIKSVNPNLDVNEVREILQKTGKRFEDESTFKSTNPRYVDAEEAVKEAIIRKGENPDNYKFIAIEGRYDYNNLKLTNVKENNNSIQDQSLKPDNINLYPNLNGKDVIVYGWKRQNNTFDVLQMFEKKQPITYQTKSVPVVQPYSQIPVVGGDKIAIPINEELKSKLSRVWVGTGTKSLNLLEMMNDYAIYGVDNSIPDGVQTLIMKHLDTGETLMTFEQALYKTAIKIGITPVYPVSFPDGTTVQPDRFISDGSKLSVKAGDTVGVAVKGDLANISIGIGDKSVTLQSIVDDYVSFKIPPDLPQGTQDVIIRHAGGNITFKDALDILISNPNLPKNDKIIISAYDNGQRTSQIYSFDPNGSNIAQLSNTLYGTWSVSWSPDKSKITLGTADTGDYEIYIMNADGTDKKKINPYNEYDDDYPFWSPDGKKIAYLKFGNRETSLVTINPDGTEFESYFTTKDYVESSIISWSPDSKKISCVRYDDESSDVNVYVTDIEKKTVTKINEPGYANFSDWTGDGKLIYTYGNTIMKSDADGTNPVVLYDATYRTINYMSTPVNGSKIAFSQSRDYGKDDIYIMDIDGSNLRKVLEENDSIDSFSWSPDGSSLVYYTNYFSDPASFWVLNINSFSKTKLELPFRYPAYSYLKWSTKNYKDKSNNKEQKNKIRISF